jgi:nucleosome binding factor SPN SPT16 subunit
VVIGNKVLRRTKTRNQGKEIDQSKQETRKQHQRELHEAILKTGIARYKGSKDGNSGGEGKTWKKFESYRREDQLPGGVKNKRVSLSLRSSVGMYLTFDPLPPLIRSS